MTDPTKAPLIAFNVAKKVLLALEEQGFRARLAGGCVRDRLMGIAPKDYDVATDALPDAVLKLFSTPGFKAIPTGVEHGTVTIVQAGIPIEVTSLREDVETDGRRAVVRFGTSFEADSLRRDFTINAMYEDKDGQIFDYHGGRDDLKANQLRFVGDASTRVREDYLRILRLFRFWARFGFRPNASALEACQKLADGLERVSQERITSELLLIFGGPARAEALAEMTRRGVMARICPEVQFDDQGWSSIGTMVLSDPRFNSQDALAALSTVLLRAVLDTSAVDLAHRLRLSNQQERLMTFAVDGLNLVPGIDQDQATKMAFIDHAERIGGSGALAGFFFPIWQRGCPREALLGAAEACMQLEAHKGSLRKAKPLLSSEQIMQAAGIGAGQKLGELIRQLLTKQRNEELTTPEEALTWLRALPPH